MFNVPTNVVYQSKRRKLWLFTALGFLTAIIIAMTMAVTFTLRDLLSSDPHGSTWSNFLIFSVIGAAAGAGFAYLLPAFQRPVDFQPRYTFQVGQYGAPFDVRMQRKTSQRALVGEGTLQFHADHLQVSGLLETARWWQITVVLAVTIVPAMWGIGLGLIPALILAKLLGRKRVQQAIPYQAVTAVSLQGNVGRIDTSYPQAAVIGFFVASQDIVRLRVELSPRFDYLSRPRG